MQCTSDFCVLWTVLLVFKTSGMQVGLLLSGDHSSQFYQHYWNSLGKLRSNVIDEMAHDAELAYTINDGEHMRSARRTLLGCKNGTDWGFQVADATQNICPSPTAEGPSAPTLTLPIHMHTSCIRQAGTRRQTIQMGLSAGPPLWRSSLSCVFL